MTARLAARVWIDALIRRVHAAGDFATVLVSGDPVAGSVALIHRQRSDARRALTRVVGPAGTTIWQVAAAGDSVDAWAERQRHYDPDLWVVELDTPELARFIDEPIV